MSPRKFKVVKLIYGIEIKAFISQGLVITKDANSQAGYPNLVLFPDSIGLCPRLL